MDVLHHQQAEGEGTFMIVMQHTSSAAEDSPIYTATQTMCEPSPLHPTIHTRLCFEKFSLVYW